MFAASGPLCSELSSFARSAVYRITRRCRKDLLCKQCAHMLSSQPCIARELSSIRNQAWRASKRLLKLDLFGLEAHVISVS